MQLTSRQKEIARIIRENEPITGETIAERLNVTRSALRGDLAVLLLEKSLRLAADWDIFT